MWCITNETAEEDDVENPIMPPTLHVVDPKEPFDVADYQAGIGLVWGSE